MGKLLDEVTRALAGDYDTEDLVPAALAIADAMPDDVKRDLADEIVAELDAEEEQ